MTYKTDILSFYKTNWLSTVIDTEKDVLLMMAAESLSEKTFPNGLCVKETGQTLRIRSVLLL